MNLNPFSNKFTSEAKKQELEVKKELADLQVIANDLMNDQRYAKFAKLIDEAEKNTIDLLLRYKEDDPYKFKTKVDELLVELRVYRNILKSAADLAKEKEQEKPNLTQSFKNRMFEILENIK